MLFTPVLITSVLFVYAALADRRREHRRSRFLHRIEPSTNVASENVEYSTSWAGAVLEEGSGTFHHVTGTFTLPVPKGSTDTVASAWVGIDGADSCSRGLLQTGVDFAPDGKGGGNYDAWYEWYPDWSYYFSNLTISAGDVIRANITAFSATSGLATIENLSNGQSGQKRLNSTYILCQQTAEWIVEDPSDVNGNLCPFPNFGKVTFHDAKASGANSTRTYRPAGATLIDIQQNSAGPLTSVSNDGSSVSITYV